MAQSRSPVKATFGYLILGAPRVGKTGLFYQIVEDRFPEHYDPTLGECYWRCEHIDGDIYAVEYEEISDREAQYPELIDKYILSSKGCLLVYSVTSRESFDRIRHLWETIREVKTKQGSWDTFVVGLIGNKTDLADERAVFTQEGRQLAKSLGCVFAECSAKSGIGCRETIVPMLKEYERKKKTLEAQSKARERVRIENQRREEIERIESQRRAEERAERLRNSRWRRVLARLRS